MFIQALNGALGIIAVMFTGVLGLDLGGVTYGMIIVGIFIVTILMYFLRRTLMMPEYDPDEPYLKEKSKMPIGTKVAEKYRGAKYQKPKENYDRKQFLNKMAELDARDRKLGR